jgi:hypothetical protein
MPLQGLLPDRRHFTLSLPGTITALVVRVRHPVRMEDNHNPLCLEAIVLDVLGCLCL